MKHAIWTIGLALIAIAPLVTADVPCSADCEVSGGAQGYLPPVLVMSNGADVHWVTNDGGPHANTAAFSDPCISPDQVSFGPNGGSADVRMDIVGSELQSTINGSTVTCTGAVALPDGSFVLHYFCVLHPTQMKAALLVLND